MSSKRPRSASASYAASASSASTSTAAAPPSKAFRSTDAAAHPLLCTLPPTCHRQPTPIASSKDLESHYATYHAHVCAAARCACVFPDAHLLELHQTECHDPIAAVRRDRGEKIFACLVPACGRRFATPRTRRLHLIQAHAFPKEYFFAVTNKGVGGLLTRWGEGASMVRGAWSPRPGAASDGGDDSGSEPPDADDVMASDDAPMGEAAPARAPDDATLDGLASSMTSLTLVPPAIRFGRGGKNGGFVVRGGPHPRGRGRGRGWQGRDAGAGTQSTR